MASDEWRVARMAGRVGLTQSLNSVSTWFKKALMFCGRGKQFVDSSSQGEIEYDFSRFVTNIRLISSHLKLYSTKTNINLQSLTIVVDVIKIYQYRVAS